MPNTVLAICRRSILRMSLSGAIVLMPAAMLGGCGSDHDAELAEQVAAAQASAERAERAQQAVEKAVKGMGGGAPVAVFADDPGDPGDVVTEGVEANENPAAEDFDNVVVGPGEGPPAPPQEIISVTPRS